MLYVCYQFSVTKVRGLPSSWGACSVLTVNSVGLSEAVLQRTSGRLAALPGLTSQPAVITNCALICPLLTTACAGLTHRQQAPRPARGDG